MTTFDNREKGFENKFALDEELMFKVYSRRNYLLGQWAATKLGKSAEDATEYAKSLVALLVGQERKSAEEHEIAYLAADFLKAGTAVSDKDIRAEMQRLLNVAREQILGDAN